MTPAQIFGRNLKRLREARRMNQEQLAAALQKRQSTISNMETGTAGLPKAVTLRALARVLRYPMEEFLVDVPEDLSLEKEPDAEAAASDRFRPGQNRRVKAGR